MADLEAIRLQALACTRCTLHETRTQVVFGRGNPRASAVLIGEGPGRDEDREGLPFVGAAGQILEQILAAVGLSEDDVFITNTVLCRPPGNRVPLPAEMEACRVHRESVLEAIDPPIVVLLGATALKAFFGPGAGITAMRGQRLEQGGRAFYPTFHPAALLRDPTRKRPVWHDFQRIVADLRLMQTAAAQDGATGSPSPGPDGEASR